MPKRNANKPAPATNEFLPGFVPYLLNRLVREMLRGVACVIDSYDFVRH